MDYEVQRCTRTCAATGRELAAGEEFYSVLVPEAGRVERRDYAVEGWSGPPEDSLGWWKSRMPDQDARKKRLTPSEVLVELFQELEQAEGNRDLRYVLALLMVRRRILKLEDTIQDERGNEVLVLYAPRDETTHQVTVVMPDEARANEIQEYLSRLLFAETP